MTVLIHGFTGSRESWDGFEGPAIDLFGHRRETAPPDISTFDEAIARLARELEPHAPFTVAGYSLGARVALALVIARPELCTRAVLIGGSAGLSSETARLERRAADEAWARMIEQEGVDRFADRWEAQPILRPASSVPHERLEHARRIRRGHTAAGLAWCLRTLGLGAMPELHSSLASVDRPITLVAGEADLKFRAIAEGMRARLPRAELQVVAGAGHNVLLEQPEALRAWLR